MSQFKPSRAFTRKLCKRELRISPKKTEKAQNGDNPDKIENGDKIKKKLKFPNSPEKPRKSKVQSAGIDQIVEHQNRM